MAMNTITVKGYIKDGKLVVDLPEHVTDGEVEVKITIEEGNGVPEEERPLSDEEIEALLRPEPKTGAEIAQSDAIGAWAHYGIEDSVEWVKMQRQKRREQRGW